MDTFRQNVEERINNMDFRKTVVVDRDIFEEKDGMRVLVARRGERVTPDTARKHGILPIESSAGPRLESKVVRTTAQHDPISELSHK